MQTDNYRPAVDHTNTTMKKVPLYLDVVCKEKYRMVAKCLYILT